MPDDTGNELPLPATRKFPALLIIIATVFLYILRFYGKSVIVFSLAELTLSMSIFLALTVVFCEIKKLEHIKTKLFRKKKPVEETDTAGETIPEEVPEVLETADVSEAAASPDGLIEIQKESVSNQDKTGKNPFLRILEISYIVCFCGIAFWRILRMFPVMRIPFTGLRSGIVDAVLLLVFPGIALIYLKIRKNEGVRPGDKTSRGMLTLFSYVSVVYAALITVSSALKINILPVLPWVFCFVSVYLVLAIAFNILLSFLKKNILSDFNYTLIPKISKTKDKKESLFDSEEIRLNFSVKSLYTIQYALKIMPGVLLGLGFVLLLSTTLFVVQPHQQALVYRLGRLSDSPVVSEGIHFKLPWPVDKADLYDVHRVSSMQIGYEAPYTANYLWTRAHEGGENTMLLGNGNEMVAVNIKIVYKIADLYSYVKNCTNPEAVLSAAAYEALMLRTVDTTLDEFLSVDRSSLSASVADELSEFCTSRGLGLSVLQVIIESIHPPVDIADIYQRVVTALVIKNTLITRAETEAEKRIIDAQQQSKTAVDNAVARQHNRTSEAQREMAVYYSAMEAYQINPRSFELTKYLDTYEKIISGNKVYVFSPGMESAISKSIIGKGKIGVSYE